MGRRESTGPGDDADQGASNRILGVAAIVLSAAIVALLIGGGVYWWMTPSETGLPAGQFVEFTGTLVDRIELNAGSLKDWNVLLISSDTTRADRIACYGNRQIQTPAIDGLARQGVLFTQAITPVPITLPGHASMLTGLDPPRHGVRSNGLFRLREGVETLASRLGANGYATGAVIGAFVLDAKFGLNRGFASYDDDLSGGESPTIYGYRERRAGSVNEAAIAWIRQHAKEKFFCFVHYFDPHFPYTPPPPWDQQYAQNPYDGEIAYVDSQVARLMAALDELDMRGRTLVIFTSDHGESLGEHGERTHAVFIYDATQRVPLIFSAPPPFPQNRIVKRQVGTVDIAPTVLAVLGVPPLERPDGISLLAPPEAGLRSMYIESIYPKLSHHWAPLLGVRRADYKFIHAPKPELYDLRADPHELNNLYDANRALAAQMYDKLREMLGADPETAADVQGNLPVDEKTRAILSSIGYVVPTTAPRASTRTAALLDPKDMIQAQLILLKAQELIGNGQYREAEQLVREFLAISPNDPEGAQTAGRIYRHLGRLDEALKWYGKSARLGHEPAEAWAGIGGTYVLKKDLTKAAEAYKTALKIDPRNPSALIGIGCIYAEWDRPVEAMKAFQDALSYGRGINAGVAYLGVSNVHRKAGRTAEADAALAKAIEVDPGNPAVAKVAASFSEGAGNADRAIEQLRKAADTWPTTDNLCQLGRLLMDQKRYQDAVTYLRKGVALDPHQADLHYQLGTALLELKQAEQGAIHISKAMELDPNHSGALSQAGILFAKAGRFKEGERLLKRAVENDPNSFLVRYNYALILANLGQFDQAAQQLRKCIELNPDYAKAFCKLGLVLAEQGKQAEAIEQYRKALKIDPKNAEANALLKAAGQ